MSTLTIITLLYFSIGLYFYTLGEYIVKEADPEIINEETIRAFNKHKILFFIAMVAFYPLCYLWVKIDVE